MSPSHLQNSSFLTNISPASIDLHTNEPPLSSNITAPLADYLGHPTDDSKTQYLRPSTDDSRTWVVYVAALVTTCVLVIALVTAGMFCYLRRRNGTFGKTSGDNHPCLNSNICEHPAYLVDRPEPKNSLKVKVCLLSYSTSPEETHAADALALYLQIHCACDVTYFRWHLDDILCLGPRKWIQEHVYKADHIVFILTQDSYDVYKNWRLGRADDRKTLGMTSLMIALFELLEKNEELDLKLKNVTYQANTPVFRVWQDYKYQTDLVHDKLNGTGHTTQATQPLRNSRVYMLMKDFSQFLADLHGISNSAMELKNRHLPTDFDHMDTAEGKQLSDAIGSLRCPLPTATGDKEIRRLQLSPLCMQPPVLFISPVAACARGLTRNSLTGEATQRFDSGFGEHSLSLMLPDDLSERNTDVASFSGGFCDVSFISPDKLSDVDSEVTSLGEKFHAINARYEHLHGDELDCASFSECYSLGGRYV